MSPSTTGADAGATADTAADKAAATEPGDATGEPADAGHGRRARPARRRRRRRMLLIVAGVLVVAVVAGSLGVAWWVSDMAIVPQHYGIHDDHSDVVRAVHHSGSSVTVVIGDPSPSTRRAGTYRMVWDGTEAKVGAIVAQSGDFVERRVLDGGAIPSVGTTVLVIGVMMTDPRTSLGLDFSEVSVPTELGPAPAWFVPAQPSASDGTEVSADTWAIAVHGQNGRRNAMIGLSPLHRAGLPTLVITYRNDEGAPPAPDGLIHYGESEYRDVEAAVRYALDHGAHHVVLYGASMGGMIVGQFLARSSLADRVRAAILDTPLLSMPAVAEFSANQHHVPEPLTWLAGEVIDWRSGVDMNQLDLLRYPPKKRPPTLVLGAASDTQAPVQSARDFAAEATRLDWPVCYEEFPGAEHTETWNADPERFERVVHEFIADLPRP